MTALLQRLLKDERGTSAIEMGLICSLVVLAMLTALQNFAGESVLTLNNVSDKTHNAVTGAVGGG